MGRGLVEAVSFDVDETLVDNRFIPGTVSETCRLAARLTGLGVGVVEAANAEVFASYWRDAEAAYALGSPSGTELQHEVWRRTLERCGHADEAVVAALAASHLRLDREQVRLFDDVERTLDALQASGARLAIVTNGASDVQRPRLAARGILERFDAVVVSAEVGVVKPDPAIFRAVVDALGLRAEGLCHVGDDTSTDVAGAQAAGVTPIWLDRRGTGTAVGPGVPTITSLTDLPGLLGGGFPG